MSCNFIKATVLNEEFQIGRKLYIGKFLSTSLEKKVAKGFTCDKGFLFIIRIKNNENKNYCYNIEKIQVVDEEGKQDNEKEILIEPEIPINNHITYWEKDVAVKHKSLKYQN